MHVPLINTAHAGVVPVIWRSSSSWVWGVSSVCLPVGFGEPGNKEVGTMVIEIIHTYHMISDKETGYKIDSGFHFNHCYRRH